MVVHSTPGCDEPIEDWSVWSFFGGIFGWT